VAQNPPGDRKMVIGTQSFAFMAGDVIKFTMALVVSDPAVDNGCPGGNFADIQKVADTAQKVFCYPLGPVITDVATLSSGNVLQVYPNPAKDALHIYLPNNSKYEYSLTDILGRTVKANTNIQNSEIIINTSPLPAGLYTIRLHNENASYSGKFVKE
jgi:hypothetical protein